MSMPDSEFEGFWTYADLRQFKIVSSRFQLTRLIQNGGFPPPIKTTDSIQSAAIYDIREVKRWLADRAAARFERSA